MIGVYFIRNNINKKYYFGESFDLEGRIFKHKEDLNNNKHHSYKLQEDWNKYGESNFMFKTNEIDVEETSVKTQAKILALEEMYIQKYDSINNGYNIEHTFEKLIKGEASNILNEFIPRYTCQYLADLNDFSNILYNKIRKYISEKDSDIISFNTIIKEFNMNGNKIKKILLNLRENKEYKGSIAGGSSVTGCKVNKDKALEILNILHDKHKPSEYFGKEEIIEEMLKEKYPNLLKLFKDNSKNRKYRKVYGCGFEVEM